ncbi:protoporphyrinogen oxidase [Antrihabitans stalactiti]|uniref:Protoporphyrinogen oxidase n=1 Tax=Antrihabitans stalactiti TaxID=2584121 RepID=A0A848KBE7_9NOCA|nr:protoporphyrinogen oxidase [Antrihabitans stalactiti]
MRFAVVGGGISGLVAAYKLRQSLGPDAEIVIAEASDRVGGKLRTVSLAGDDIDIGAEAFVGRRPEVPALLRELGLADQLVHPSGLRPVIWADGDARPLPPGTLMGIPAGPEYLDRLVDGETLAKIEAEPTTQFAWDRTSDCTVEELVAARFGEQVVQRSVDPLLGGVYSGSSRTIGVRGALPTLATALDDGAPSLTEAVRRALPPPSTAPVFGGIRDGYGVLLDALVRESAADVRVGTRVQTITRVPGGQWAIGGIGPVDGVVLALPARWAAELLSGLNHAAAQALREVPLASSALVALAFPAGVELPQRSGILVATGEPLRAKAFTLSSRKWPHLAEREVKLVRASFGRFGDPVSAWSDAELIGAAREDFAVVSGVLAEPVDALVQHWPDGLPQYGPGHLDRVAAVEAGIAELDGIEIAGAFLHGVGVPACVASGAAAATRLVAR